ncbi:hypothetical protein RGUI_0784 [Rhodovulum sp. P5]|nr:hypothetical protein RGUI_0784 [Rhodovulum sp. P5]
MKTRIGRAAAALPGAAEGRATTALEALRQRRPVMIGLVAFWAVLELVYFLDLGLLDYVPFLRWLAFLGVVAPVLLGIHLLARRLGARKSRRTRRNA